MTGRVLSEEEMAYYENEGYTTDETDTLIQNAFATIRDRNKLLCIEKQSNRTLALMVDRAKEALEERDKTISELKLALSARRQIIEMEEQALQDWANDYRELHGQNTILREALEWYEKRSLGSIAREALAKVRGDE